MPFEVVVERQGIAGVSDVADHGAGPDVPEMSEATEMGVADEALRADKTDGATAVRAAVTVAPITRTIRGIPSEVPVDRRHGLRAVSVANCDSLQTIPKEVLGRRAIGTLSIDELPALDRALRFALGIRT